MPDLDVPSVRLPDAPYAFRPAKRIQRHDRDRRLDRPRGAERVPVQPLGAGHRHAGGVLAQRQVQRLRLRQLIQLRG